MSCIHEAYNLGTAPARYLRSGTKENSYAASILKTAAAVALLVPGIILTLSSFVLHMLISPCCGSQFKGRVTNQSGKITIAEQRENEISLLVNLSPDYWVKWGEALTKLNESMEVFKKEESFIRIGFRSLDKNGSKSQDDALLRDWEAREDAILKAPSRDNEKENYKIDFSLPDRLKEGLSAAKTAISASAEPSEFRRFVALPIYENRNTFLKVFETELNNYYLLSSEKYFDLFNQLELGDLNSLLQAFYKASLVVWLAMRDLYAAEKNDASVAKCEGHIARIQAISDELQSKIEQRLSSE